MKSLTLLPPSCSAVQAADEPDALHISGAFLTLISSLFSVRLLITSSFRRSSEFSFFLFGSAFLSAVLSFSLYSL